MFALLIFILMAYVEACPNCGGTEKEKLMGEKIERCAKCGRPVDTEKD